MQKSYVVKATLCIEECQFYLRAGDVLMYNSVTRSLTVYRANTIVKTLEQSPISISGFVKTGMLSEVTAPVAVAALPKPAPGVATPQAPKASAKKTGFTAEEFTPAVKRGKAQAKSIPVEEMPDRLKQALAATPETIA